MRPIFSIQFIIAIIIILTFFVSEAKYHWNQFE